MLLTGVVYDYNTVTQAPSGDFQHMCGKIHT